MKEHDGVRVQRVKVARKHKQVYARHNSATNLTESVAVNSAHMHWQSASQEINWADTNVICAKYGSL